MIASITEPEEMLIYLDDDFSLPKCSSSCHVTLRSDHFYYETSRVKERISERILIKDVFSCCVSMISTNCERQFFIDLKIIAYPLVKGERLKKKLAFRVHKGNNTWEEDFEIAQKWKELILEAMYSIPGGLKSTVNYENIRTTRPLFSRKEVEKKLVVYVNPRSGTGISHKIYKNYVKPMLSETGIRHDVILTEDRFVAYNSIQTLDLNEITGIVVISGDGLLYEIYNGLLRRKDWYDAISFPISIIPGGSGNGLATSVGYVLSEPYIKNPVLVSTLNILNPIITPMDLVIVNTIGRKRLLSFLSISFGFLADVDIESERLRGIGEARFTIWSIKRLLSLRTYRCRLSYKTARKTRCQRKGYSPLKCLSASSNGSNNGISLSRVKSDCIQTNSTGLPNEIPDENDPPLRSDILKGNVPSPMEDDDDDEFYPDYAKILIDKSFTDPNFNVLGEPVPANWQVVEDDFILIFAAFKPFIGKDGFISPLSSLSDAVMYLWVMRKGAPKKAILSFLLSISHGPEPNEYVQRIPVTAFRIEPSCATGNLVVDGEVIDYGPIQASLLPGKGSVMTKPI